MTLYVLDLSGVAVIEKRRERLECAGSGDVRTVLMERLSARRGEDELEACFLHASEQMKAHTMTHSKFRRLPIATKGRVVRR